MQLWSPDEPMQAENFREALLYPCQNGNYSACSLPVCLQQLRRHRGGRLHGKIRNKSATDHAQEHCHPGPSCPYPDLEVRRRPAFSLAGKHLCPSGRGFGMGHHVRLGGKGGRSMRTHSCPTIKRNPLRTSCQHL